MLDEKHGVFLISAVVEKQDLREWEAAYSDVLRHGFVLGVRASRTSSSASRKV